jgi:hypothetical protein
MLGGTIAAVCSRCQSQRNYEFAMDRFCWLCDVSPGVRSECRDVDQPGNAVIGSRGCDEDSAANSVLKAITILRPETVVRWHRTGFRRYWRWKSRNLGGRPQIDADLRVLIRRMSVDNPLWGAPRIHGELLKLGFEVAQSSVAKYMVKRCGLPSQRWLTFLRNHAPDIAAMDLFVVPTVGFDLLYVLVIVRLARRDLIWINVTPNPTADWIAHQITEAFPWNEAPRYLIRDRDQVYGAVVTHRLRAMGIRDKPIAPGSPWQNGFAEKADRIDPSRVHGPCRRPGRGALAPGPTFLRALL